MLIALTTAAWKITTKLRNGDPERIRTSDPEFRNIMIGDRGEVNPPSTLTNFPAKNDAVDNFAVYISFTKSPLKKSMSCHRAIPIIAITKTFAVTVE
jgi:hypothetical protein